MVPAASGLARTIPWTTPMEGVRVAMVPAALSVTIAGTFTTAPAARRAKVAVVIEAAFMGLLNVTVTFVIRGTPVAPGAGDRAITVGATSVEKLQTMFVPSALPTASVTVPATVAVYTVPVASGVVSVRLAMVPVASSVTVAGTCAAAPAARRVKVVGTIEAAFMGLLNVAVTVVLSGTPLAPGAGDWAITVGAASVVKLQTKIGRAWWREGAEISAVAVALKKEPAASGLVGVSVAMVPVASRATVAGPFTTAPAARRLKVAAVIEAAFMGLLNVAETVALVATPVAPGAGDWAITVGAVSVVKLQTTGAATVTPVVSATVAAIVAV